MTLHSILGSGRVKKRKTPSSSSSKSKYSPWTASLPRTKSITSFSSSSKTSPPQGEDPLPSSAPIRLPIPNPPPTIPQAHALIRTLMFSPLPERASGLSPAKIASILTFRDALPPVVTTSHIATLMPSPTAAERAIAGMVREGRARRVVVPRRDGIGELLVLSEDSEGMVRGAKGLDGGTKEGFLKWLRGMDELVRAGFLTAVNEGGGQTGLYARPAERHAMLSLEMVSRASAGTMEAVGGEGALYAAGGTGARMGGRGGGNGGGTGGLRCAVPGGGAFLKLVSGALEHLTVLLERARYREMPESDLREKWDGGIAGDKEAFLAKKNRGEFSGILPGRTKKWKDFYGVSFDWVLREAVGSGVVEVFETHTVGRGVRLV
ncbi:serine-threonine protein kinase 19-domain-containing protein [Cercophora newfieldiana]|uniref:Serine-threonine protein kinase 19-domain-containing protein n=1 Tax=Cercophora newfieldiana TaxID=92897 RepID=A0AA39YRA8_9PEZI|nr:serine-threonine protein kinase 19-domain-containing protein [Cercophora newfieldiana]